MATQGEQINAVQQRTVLQTFNSLANDSLKEFNNVKEAYLSAAADILTSKSIAGSLNQALEFILKGEQLMVQTQQELANALGRTTQFNIAFKRS